MEYLHEGRSLDEFVENEYIPRTGALGDVLFLRVMDKEYVSKDQNQLDAYRMYPTDTEIFVSSSLRGRRDAGAICYGGPNSRKGVDREDLAASVESCTTAWFDDKDFTQKQGIWGCLLILFMVRCGCFLSSVDWLVGSFALVLVRFVWRWMFHAPWICLQEVSHTSSLIFMSTHASRSSCRSSS